MRKLVFISTHLINGAVISEYIKMSKVKDVDCILAIDNSNLKIEIDSRVKEMEFYGTKVKCFFFDEQLHNELNLPCYFYNRKAENFSEIMWYNGDYRFYYVRKFFPDYDFYWQFDYDIFCNGDSYQEFFSKYEKFEEDLLVCDLRPEQINGEWYWSSEIDWAYDGDFYASFFPICRLSSRAIDFLYKKRFERGEQYLKLEDKTHSMWIFCETFAPNELIKNGFSAHSIDEKYVSSEVWNIEFDLNENRLFEHPDNQLYHPVKGDYVNRMNKLKAENENLKSQIEFLEKEKNKYCKYLRKIFSIGNVYSNNNKYKVLTLFGIKIKKKLVKKEVVAKNE